MGQQDCSRLDESIEQLVERLPAAGSHKSVKSGAIGGESGEPADGTTLEMAGVGRCFGRNTASRDGEESGNRDELSARRSSAYLAAGGPDGRTDLGGSRSS